MLKKIFFTVLASMCGIIGVYGQINKYVVDINDFTQIKVSSPINVIYKCNPDSVGKAVFNSTSEMASEIAFMNNSKKLVIGFTTRGAKFDEVPTVTVYSRFLTVAENHCDSLLKIASVAPCPEFKLRLMGNGRVSAIGVEATTVSASITTGHGSIAITGKCETANFTSYSAGVIQADELEATNVKCRLVGTGEIGCWPVESLSVSGAFSGKIFYRGNPEEIKSSNSLRQKIHRIGD